MSRSVLLPRTATVFAVVMLGAAAAPAAADDSPGTGRGDGSVVTVIDNSHADSIIEVDRTANAQTGSGTAGSDHDGSAVDAIEALKGAPTDDED
ncbi:hypothetical protein ACGF7W_33815 [Streptomyces sp. NPDC048219]|uniref:hypothetical protein n=1 Tax=unclassified Streptomyces TaxID=2593676 RepID=UPI003421D0F1